MTNTEILEAKIYFEDWIPELEERLHEAVERDDYDYIFELEDIIRYYKTALVALNNAELEMWNRSK